MPFTNKDLYEAIGATVFMHWQTQKQQEEMYLAQLAEKDKEIAKLKSQLPLPLPKTED